MAITTSINFDNEANFTLTNAQIDGSLAKLGFVPNPEQTFSEDFADDTGFTYDSDKAEFDSGILRQKDQTPTDALFHSKFSTKDANWSDGSEVGTLVGDATVSGDKLNLTDSNDNYLEYSGVSNTPSGDQACIRFTYTPNVSGAVSGHRYLYTSSNTEDNIANLIRLFVLSNNTLLRWDIYDSSGTFISTVQTGNNLTLTAGVPLEIELNFDTTSGEHRLFVDGINVNGLQTGTGTRSDDSTIIRIGKDYTSASNNGINGTIDDLTIYNSVQHTSNYTPSENLPIKKYSGAKVDGPNFVYSGLGTVLSVDDGSITETGSARYIIGLQYWTGTEWAVSDGTYAQANNFATILANLETFDTGGGGVLPWSVVFTDSNTLSSVDEFSVEVTGQKYATEGTILSNTSMFATDINSFSSVLNEDDADVDIKFIQKVDTGNKYWNGSAWANSNGTFSQANTLQEVIDNIENLISANSEIKTLNILKTADQLKSPTITSIEYNYDFGANDVGSPSTCNVCGFLKDIQGNPISDATVKVSLKVNRKQYNEANNAVIDFNTIEDTTDDSGFFSLKLIRTSEYDKSSYHTGQYTLIVEKNGVRLDRFKNGSILFEVPDQTEVNISELIDF